jgi:hypothetical protein
MDIEIVNDEDIKHRDEIRHYTQLIGLTLVYLKYGIN